MNRQSWRTCRSAAGFSFVELLVTIVIAGIAFGGLVPVFVLAAKSGSQDKSRVVALNIAQQAIEGSRRLNFEQVVTDSWTQHEQTATGVKPFTVTRTVVDGTASATDARIVSKQVSIEVSWSRPSPGGSVVLKTVLYRQYAGPQIVDFSVAPWDALNEVISDSNVQLTAIINAADVESMAPVEIAGTTLSGYVEFRIQSVSGVVIPTIIVPYNDLSPSVYTATWLIPGGAGVNDGYWTFKAVAFSAQKYPGNTWEFAKRVESGAPAPVTALEASPGEDWVSLTWSPSVSSDLDHYEVFRTGPDGVAVLVAGDPATDPGFVATGFTDAGLLVDTEYTYDVYTVDQFGNTSGAATVVVTTGATLDVQPLPATDLRATFSGSTAVLTWTASPTVGVLGYRVYKDGDGATAVETVSGPYCNLSQGYDTSATYQVKPYSEGSNLTLTEFATTAVDQAVEDVGGTLWAEVTIPEEPEFTLSVMNNVKSGKQALITLKYLGPEGNTTAVTILPTQRIAYSTTQYLATWSELSAGVYQINWEGSGMKSGSRLVTLALPQLVYMEKCIP